MSIEATCPHCGHVGGVNDRLAGRRVRCRQCDQPMEIPAATASGSVDDSGLEPEMIREPGIAPESAAVTSGFETDPITGADSFSAGSPSTPLADPALHASGVVPAGPPVLMDDSDDGEPDQVMVRAKKPEDEMDMTPMVDVTFLLLIFFMVTAAFSLQKSIEMPRQQSDAPSSSQEEEEEEKEVVDLEIDEYGSFLVLAPQWERQTPGKQNLITALKEASAGSSDPMTLNVKVHELAKIKSLVDAMDAGTIASYNPIKVTQVTEFE